MAIKFGTSGNSDSFKENKKLHTKDVPLWLHERGLNCYEVSFGLGVNMSEASAELNRAYFDEYSIEISGHCPYYINLATDEEEKAVNNVSYIVKTMQIIEKCGGNRSVFHPGSPKKLSRAEAMNNAFRGLDTALGRIYSEGLQSHKLAVETMGKLGQLGDTDEIIELCKRDPMLYPCIDFGHVNSREQGSLKTADDYKRLISKFIDGLGFERVSDMHVHFSKIQYTAQGELRHLTFADDIYGPEYEPFLEVVHEYGLKPYIICESSGTQAEDAIKMAMYYEKLINIK